MKNRGNLIAVFLGILLAVLAALLGVLFVMSRPPKLSEDKMREYAAAAQEAGLAADSQAEAGGGSWEEGVSKKMEPFEVKAAGSSKKAGAKEDKGQEAEEGQEAAGENGFLCTYSSERLMTDADVADLNSQTFEGLPQGKSIIQMVINEMYARYGYQFQNEEIQAYFDQKAWYKEIPVRNSNMEQISGNMTSTERSNVEFLSGHL